MSSRDAIDERLDRLARETLAIRPTRGFTERVMRGLRAEAERGLWAGLSRCARQALPLALLIAVGAIAWAFASEHAVSTAFVGSEGTELEW
jgi:hypothetical protein